MDEPPRKRRKTASPNASELTPSPLKKHPRRPSFASPTKANLARYNPSLLQTGREALIKRGKQARAFIFGGDAEESAGVERSQQEIGQTGVGTGPDNSLAKSITNPSTKVRRNLRRSPSVEEEGDEPELPQTSPHALEQDTPRRGMLFSSPSKPPPRKPSGAHPAFNSKQPQNLERSRETENGVEGHEDQDKEGAEKKEPPDPELESRKREKEKLLREMAELQNDVEQCIGKVKWLHSQSPSQVIPPGERDDLISLINKMNDSGMVEKEEPQPTISNLLCSFLPYTAQAIPQPQKEHDSQDIPSHHPIELDDPLPYLQMFTSLQFTPRISLADLEGLDDSSRYSHQKLTIDIVGPQKLLAGSVEATIDTISHTIVHLQVPRLSHWAEKELGPFMREKAQQNDLSCVCWAMESYWELARKRSEYWRKCEMAFSHLISGRVDGDGDNAWDISGGDVSKSITRKGLLRLLGRDTLVLEDKHVLLKLSWRIRFDWTGEAESNVNVEAAYPRVWAEADTSKSLKTIPQTFHSLVEARGVFEATKIMVTLLFDRE